MAVNPFAAAATGNPWITGASIGLSALNSLFGDDAGEDLQRRAIALQERAYNDREPLRAMGLARLEANRPTRPDLGADFADPSNPFYRAPQALGFGKGYAGPGASEGESKLRSQGLASLVPNSPGIVQTGLSAAKNAVNAAQTAGPRLPGEPILDYMRRIRQNNPNLQAVR